MFPRDPVPGEAISGAGADLVLRLLRPAIAGGARVFPQQAQAQMQAPGGGGATLSGGTVQLVLSWLSRSSAAAGDWLRLDAFLRAAVDAALALGSRGALLRVLPLVETAAYAVQVRPARRRVENGR